MDSNKIEKRRAKILLLSIIAILSLIAAIAGGTYAFFSATAVSGEYVTGQAAKPSMDLEVKLVSAAATATAKMMPLEDASIQSAVTGASGKGSCIDELGNIMCKVYSIKITNKSDVKFNIQGNLTLSASTIPNLKWAKGTTATTGFPNSNEGPFYSSFNTFVANTSTTTQTTHLVDDVLNPTKTSGDSKTYYVAIWLSSTPTGQSDKGSFTGRVSFDAYIEGNNGVKVQGVSSTFTG